MKLYEKVFYFISGHGRGWAFSSNDLAQKFTRQEIDKKELSPDIEQVARAYARKFNWNIEVSGDTALNVLGLSTQVVGNYIYLSNGSNKTYTLNDGRTIEFKKSALKNIGFKYKESSLIVQALKVLGKEHITDEVITKIREQIDEKMYEKILKDTKTATLWIYETIKQICQKEPNTQRKEKVS